MKERLPNVLVAVAGEGAQIAVESIYLFHPRAETVMLELLDRLTRGGVQPLAVGIEQQHVTSEVAEADDVGASLTDSVVRVLGHGDRVLVGEGDRPEVEGFLEKPHQPVPFLEPVPAVDAESSLGTGRIKKDEPRRPAILHRKAVQKPEDLRYGVHREPHNGNHAKMAVADPRPEAPDQVLGREYGIEVHRNGPHSHLVAQSGDARV